MLMALDAWLVRKMAHAADTLAAAHEEQLINCHYTFLRFHMQTHVHAAQ